MAKAITEMEIRFCRPSKVLREARKVVFEPMWLLFLIFLAVAEYGDIKFRLAGCGLAGKRKGEIHLWRLKVK